MSVKTGAESGISSNVTTSSEQDQWAREEYARSGLSPGEIEGVMGGRRGERSERIPVDITPDTAPGWAWTKRRGYTYNGQSVPEGPTRKQGVAYNPGKDPTLIRAGIYEGKVTRDMMRQRPGEPRAAYIRRAERLAKKYEKKLRETITIVPTKPDKPGGQIATIEGQKVYIKGSTMRDQYGFATEAEYRAAQRVGETFGSLERIEVKQPKKAEVPRKATTKDIPTDKYLIRGIKLDDDRVQFITPGNVQGEMVKVSKPTFEKYKDWADTLAREQAQRVRAATALSKYGDDIFKALQEGKEAELRVIYGDELVEANKRILGVSGGDVAKYARFAPEDKKTLKAAGFTEEGIKKVKEYNKKLYGVAAPDFVERSDFIEQYFEEQGWGKVPFYGLDPQGQKSSNKEIQARFDEANEVYDKEFRPEVSAQDFIKNYFTEKGWDSSINRSMASVEELRHHDARYKEARDFYKQKFGTSAVVESAAGQIGYVVSPARALRPEVKLKDIGGMEWALTGGQVALLASGIGGLAPIVRTGLAVGGTGLFVAHTVDRWDEMSNVERAVDVGITALIMVPVTWGVIRQVRQVKGGKATAENYLARQRDILKTKRAQVAEQYGEGHARKLDDVFKAQEQIFDDVKVLDDLQKVSLTKAAEKAAVAKTKMRMLQTDLLEANTPLQRGKVLAYIERQQQQLVKAENTLQKLRSELPVKIERAEFKTNMSERRLNELWDDFVNDTGRTMRVDSDSLIDYYKDIKMGGHTRGMAEAFIEKGQKIDIAALRQEVVRLGENMRKVKVGSDEWVAYLNRLVVTERRIAEVELSTISNARKAVETARSKVKAAQQQAMEERAALVRKPKTAPDYIEAKGRLAAAEERVKALQAAALKAEERYMVQLNKMKELDAQGVADDITSGGTGIKLKTPTKPRTTIRDATGREVKFVDAAGVSAGARAAVVAERLVDAVSRQRVEVEAGEPVRVFDPERISRIIEEAGANPSEFNVVAIEAEIKQLLEGGVLTDIEITNKIKDITRDNLRPDVYPASEPAQQPAQQPAPQTEPKPDPIKPPIKAPIETVLKPPPDPPWRGLKPLARSQRTSAEDDEEKREYLGKVSGMTAFRNGELNGQDVWLVDYYPYRPQDRLVLMGAPPEGARMAEGSGSVQRSATLIKGIPPAKPIFRDTGAVDRVIAATPDRKGIVVRSVKDKSTKSPAYRPRAKPKEIARQAVGVGDGIAYDKTGRGHLV